MSQYDFVKGSICVSVKLSTVVAVEVYGVVVCVSLYLCGGVWCVRK